jgi:hypothetical protein
MIFSLVSVHSFLQRGNLLAPCAPTGAPECHRFPLGSPHISGVTRSQFHHTLASRFDGDRFRLVRATTNDEITLLKQR